MEKLRIVRNLRLLEAMAIIEAAGDVKSPLALAVAEVKRRRTEGHKDTHIWVINREGAYLVGAETDADLNPAHGELSNSDMPETAPIQRFKIPIDNPKKV